MPIPMRRPAVNPSVWKAFAGGPAVRIPTVGSRVYYFPQGHVEHSSSTPNFSALIPSPKPYFPYRVSALRHLFDPDTEEVFLNIALDPQISNDPPPEAPDAGGDGVTMFAKILTNSDGSQGGGFTVPRACAVSVFPPLDLTADDLPSQDLEMKDLLGNSHRFHHVFRGKPQRHLLTTGWSDFVRAKNLIPGDSVVFVRNRECELFIGIQRRRRRNLGRVVAESVVEAVRLAGSNRPFEVEYYPRSGSSLFVVAEGKVEAAMAVRWTVGSRVRFTDQAVENSKQGTVSKVALAPHSPWGMLKIVWDETNVLHSVSPWQVELMPGNFQTGLSQLMSGNIQIDSSHPASKKLRISPNPELSSSGGGSNSTIVGRSSPSMIDFIGSFPDSIQGARQDSSNALRSCNCDGHIKDASQDENFNVLGINVTSQEENSSQKNQDNIPQHGDTKLASNQISNQAKEGGISIIRLFGQTINVKHPCDEDATTSVDPWTKPM